MHGGNLKLMPKPQTQHERPQRLNEAGSASFSSFFEA